MVVHVYSPIPLEAEGGGLKVLNQPELICESILDKNNTLLPCVEDNFIPFRAK